MGRVSQKLFQENPGPEVLISEKACSPSIALDRLARVIRGTSFFPNSKGDVCCFVGSGAREVRWRSNVLWPNQTPPPPISMLLVLSGPTLAIDLPCRPPQCDKSPAATRCRAIMRNHPRLSHRQ